jgi:hypothetical protein
MNGSKYCSKSQNISDKSVAIVAAERLNSIEDEMKHETLDKQDIL